MTPFLYNVCELILPVFLGTNILFFKTTLGSRILSVWWYDIMHHTNFPLANSPIHSFHFPLIFVFYQITQFRFNEVFSLCILFTAEYLLLWQTVRFAMLWQLFSHSTHKMNRRNFASHFIIQMIEICLSLYFKCFCASYILCCFCESMENNSEKNPIILAGRKRFCMLQIKFNLLLLI